MLKRIVFLGFVTVLLSSAAHHREHDWQTARVFDVRSKYFETHGGTTTNGRVDDYGNFHATSSDITMGHTRYSYTIDTGKYLIMASELLNWRWSKSARVIIGENIQYELYKRNVYLLDLDGKVHKLYLQRQELRPQAAAAQPLTKSFDEPALDSQ